MASLPRGAPSSQRFLRATSFSLRYHPLRLNLHSPHQRTEGLEPPPPRITRRTPVVLDANQHPAVNVKPHVQLSVTEATSSKIETHHPTAYHRGSCRKSYATAHRAQCLLLSRAYPEEGATMRSEPPFNLQSTTRSGTRHRAPTRETGYDYASDMTQRPQVVLLLLAVIRVLFLTPTCYPPVSPACRQLRPHVWCDRSVATSSCRLYHRLLKGSTRRLDPPNDESHLASTPPASTQPPDPLDHASPSRVGTAIKDPSPGLNSKSPKGPPTRLNVQPLQAVAFCSAPHRIQDAPTLKHTSPGSSGHKDTPPPGSAHPNMKAPRTVKPAFSSPRAVSETRERDLPPSHA
ncbi:hypothetical protein BDK51DRAFT_43260 [Blyttiomyces helicus]|uniref:Uncharacterized protein n=1 Tax=Blyttiomyces helicus TaxID=388810 RepID=A0A4P9WRJ5_9FUNG|nr:hypothetical protein BDK51DRAFT_43260 [Blyttiomyces helicus]|eukprot:RKO94498.1 hypothetical protein BDK51DRAFT_43260 [Blyttiomyces helicus]